MHGAAMLAIVFGGIVLALAIVGSTILMGIKILKGGISRKGQRLETEEARIIQEVYQGLKGLEERVEALETLILERERKER